MAMSATLLLPASGQLAGISLPTNLARALARADHRHLAGDSQQQLARHFDVGPALSGAWPVAALTRQLDAGDAGDQMWLRADPAHVAADMQGVRLLSHGVALAVEPAHVAPLLADLQEVFTGHGMVLSAPDPARWYLKVPREMALPELVDVDRVLGDDLFDHLPAGAAGLLWRSLLSETQILLHQHPLNSERAAKGQAAINSLWFWGAGQLPAEVRNRYGQVRSPDPLLQSLAAIGEGGEESQQLVDLRHLRNPQMLIEQALLPLLSALNNGELAQLQLDFADGPEYLMRSGQRWRFWRHTPAHLGE